MPASQSIRISLQSLGVFSLNENTSPAVDQRSKQSEIKAARQIIEDIARKLRGLP